MLVGAVFQLRGPVFARISQEAGEEWTRECHYNLELSTRVEATGIMADIRAFGGIIT